jgi:CRP/FNR family cyclic AMP-dependent transcriptional regulator
MRFRRVSLKEQLARVPLFEDLSEVDLDHVARLAVRVREPAGEILIKEAESGNEFLIVLEGQVEVVRDDRAVTTLGPGDFLGEVALLDERAKRTATVTARTPVTIGFVSRQDFSRLLSELPELARQIRETAARRVADDAQTSPD